MTEIALIEDRKVLEYDVWDYSSYASNFFPKNILEDKPGDQMSRWTSDSSANTQYIVLKLKHFAIVEAIQFGKFEKAHISNLKKFKVYGGVSEEDMVELLEGGLGNNSKAEKFALRHKVSGNPFAVRFIKVVPLQSWSPNFNYTVWHVSVFGNDNWAEVQPAMNCIATFRKTEALRLCMKFLRQYDYVSAYEKLLEECDVQLEKPCITRLYQLAKAGDYVNLEKFVESSIKDGYFDDYLCAMEYKPKWFEIIRAQHPDRRGGHQMCIDSDNQLIYLLGGWNGHQDLSDLWRYNLISKEWELLSEDTQKNGGPSARSCHKMCIDCKRGKIYVLGRYLDIQYRYTDTLKSDFFCYDVKTHSWTLLSNDTFKDGGPKLVFDHQMCMDEYKDTIYVFGGKVLLPHTIYEDDQDSASAAPNEPIYSGLYSYHVPTRKWTLLNSEKPNDYSRPIIKSRVGHSMLFHPVRRKLYIFAGQRMKDYLNDFFAYDVDQGTFEFISNGGPKECDAPSAGFTQRATIDPNLDEIYVLSGLNKDKDRREDHVQNSFWVYFIKKNKWSCIYSNENSGLLPWCKVKSKEPCPRFAHQLVYDCAKKQHYLFGGNPGVQWSQRMRLHDFWSLTLTRPSKSQVLKKCIALVRKYRYQELVNKDPVAALTYLQKDVQEVMDLLDPSELQEFQKMPMMLFGEWREPDCTSKVLEHRSTLFNTLAKYFQDSLCCPKYDLVDLIPV